MTKRKATKQPPPPSSLEENESDVVMEKEWEDIGSDDSDAASSHGEDAGLSDVAMDGLDGEEVDEYEMVDNEEDDTTPVAKKQRTAEDIAESRKKQKELAKERKLSKPLGEQLVAIKKLWGKLRHEDTPKKEHEGLVKDILEAMGEGKVSEFMFKHDASRVIQACVKYGSASQRKQVADEFKGRSMELIKSKYGKYLLVKILKYCPGHRDAIFEEFRGKIVKLIKHREAAAVIEQMFYQYTNAAQRTRLTEEFYGPEYAIYRRTLGKEAPKASLDAFLSEADATPERREALIRHMHETLTSVLNKGTYTLAITHRVMAIYLQVACNPRHHQQLCDLLRENICDIVHTKDGAKVAASVVLHATAKDRKVLVRNMKEWAVKMACSEYGWWPLIQTLDCVDDTVLLGKCIISELTKEWSQVVLDLNGRRVVLFLLTGRSHRYFTKDVLATWAETDRVRAETSKKDPEIRRLELLKLISPTALEYVAHHTRDMLVRSLPAQVLAETIINAVSDKSEAIKAIANLLHRTVTADVDADGTLDLKNNNPVRTIKLLIQLDHNEGTPTGMTKAIWEAIEGHVIKTVQLGGAFIVIALINSKSADAPTVKAAVVKELEKERKKLEKFEQGELGKQFAGVRVLAAEMRNLKAH